MNDQSLQFTKNEEGYRQFAYQCTAGKQTIGIGFNLTDVGLSEEESLVILQMRMDKLEVKLMQHIAFFNGLCLEKVG